MIPGADSSPLSPPQVNCCGGSRAQSGVGWSRSAPQHNTNFASGRCLSSLSLSPKQQGGDGK